jgi:hypothetical protein
VPSYLEKAQAKENLLFLKKILFFLEVVIVEVRSKSVLQWEESLPYEE